jgi:2-polyprenyl-3-methyl-5-hydroxy-6-metoxy-1,4-benzoquinol methylase
LNPKNIREKCYRNSGNLSLIGLLSDPTSGHVLDIGCGNGANAGILKAQGATVDGITISPTELEEAKVYCDRVALYDLENGLPEEFSNRHAYDLVICSHVLEHLRYPEKLLGAVRHIIKPNGYLLIALPNIMFYKTRLKLAFGNFDYEENGLMDQTHYRWFTYRSAQKLLVNAGYKIVRIGADGGAPLVFMRRLIPSSVAKRIDNLFVRIRPGLFGVQILVKAQPDSLLWQ